MNYCLLQDAWNTPSHQLIQPTAPVSSNNSEHFTNTKQLSCEDFVDHITKCDKCKKQMMHKFKSNAMEKFS